jgi:hypothetical protein
MTVVIVTPRGKKAEAVVKQLLPNPIAIVAGLRVYHFFSVVGDTAPDVALADLDGEVLTEFKTFPTLDAAKAWVDADVERRGAERRR